MRENYLSREDHSGFFQKLADLRTRIAAHIPVSSGMRILDLASGYGYFAIEIARFRSDIKIVGIDISEIDVSKSRENIDNCGFSDRIKIGRMDAANMGFLDSSFDMVANFLGLEDIHMTRGREGVEKTFCEVARVLKPGGYFCFTVMLPEEVETEAQRIEVEVFSWLCGATWLSAEDYKKMLRDNGLKSVSRKTYYTGKKLTTAQAKEEIHFACENVQRLYGITTPTFDEAWSRFGSRIDKYGMGHYSRVVMMIARK
ncbi:class I SAM-dependent methyltransferase [candidate division WOR-3 bacterium]|nr:class I SAM-dependent methyltransferase [candidate division WOR-3 bacterium]